MPPARLVFMVCVLSCLAVSARAQTDTAFTTNVLFTITNAAGSSNVFVAGSVSSLGSWDVTRAPQLRNIGSNVWEARVALPFGTNVTYRFFRRSSASGSFGDTNVTWLGAGNSSYTSPVTPPGPYTGKMIYYHSGWTNANVLWRQSTSESDWVNTPMTRIGTGRTTNEYLYRVAVGKAAWPIEFVPNNGAGAWDNAFGIGGSNYLTPLDFIFLQDGHVFNYWPPATVSAPRFVTNNITSSYTGNGIPSRRVRALLPRGYTQNTSKRYPVLYMHDGQNDFSAAGGTNGGFGSWDADLAATREIQMGRVREMIVVAVDNTGARMAEYGIPGDSYQGTQGTGDRYRDFIVNNVRPWVDTSHRTLNDPPNTGVMGSSLGGLISHYMGVSTNVFGLVAAISPSYWYAPNWRSSFHASTKPTNRLFYMDCGSSEGSSMWDHFGPMVTNMISKGFSFGDDFYYVIGVGQQHNEAAWAARLPFAFRYLYDIRRERNSMVVAAFPPSLNLPSTAVSNTTRHVGLTFPTLGGVTYQLQRTTNLQAGGWTNVTTLTPGAPWGEWGYVDAVPASDPQDFYRLKAISPTP
ncbi:MAG: hypothetical protein IAE97_02020 [Chthoniobacterales bacterium]|nr:hypothetical protein [Chthoniobacterales bacterium]